MKRLNIIGGGKVGKTLGYLWSKGTDFEIQDILNRSLESAEQTSNFIGSGRAVDDYQGMRAADMYLISTSDGTIEECCRKLAEFGGIPTGSIVFHCSGALTSAILSSAIRKNALVASVHPVKSFADPAASVSTFPGTYCGIEGDPQATELLIRALKSIGAETFAIDPQFKTVYHSASVIICNYLVALLDVGTKTYMKSGIPRETVLELMKPMVQGTLDNVFKLDTIQALTGPIARGDHSVVSKQLDELTEWDEKIGRLYKILGSFTLELSRSQNNARPADLEILGKLLDS
ncbi:MAG: DUF2520 domain-containing protein [Proteobacteria bacterium]|nr:DUF2520 domain-containing protein [Pseudomonadota bacterium]